MRVLVVCHGAPNLMSGTPKRNLYLLRALCARHRVTLVIINEDVETAAREAQPLLPDLDILRIVATTSNRYKRVTQIASVALRQPSITLRFSTPALGRALRELLAAERYDAIVFESVIVADHYLPSGPLVVIDEHNLEYELVERSALQAGTAARKIHYTLEAAALKRVELRLLAQADLVSVTSARERNLLANLIPDASVVVAPNGVDIEDFAPEPEEAEIAGRIVLTGAMDYHPNEQAAHYFASEIWPAVRDRVPGATWYLVGARPPESFDRLAALPGVTITGLVPRTQPYLAEAQVAIAPLLVGGGTRIKILEALAMGKAVVTTTPGCEGLEAVSGEHLIVADSPADFAAATVRLLGDREERARLGAAGRALVEERYSWARSGDLLVEAIERRADERKVERNVAVAGD